MSERRLPYGRQCVDESDIQAVVDVLRSDFLTTGPAVSRFEDALCRASGAKHAIAVNSGTAALHAIYAAAGIGPGDEVVTTPLTFAATANAALYLGATVRFVDVDPATGAMDPARLSAAVNERTKAIAPVDFTGRPADYDAIHAIAREHDVAVIADAAHSLGGSYRGRPVGSLADASIFSFHPVKVITTGEGGAVVTDREDWARDAAEFRTHGITRDEERLEQSPGPWWYEMRTLGYNYRMSDIHAALGVSQLARLASFVERRQAIARLYAETLCDIDGLRLPPPDDDAYRSAWHLFVVRTDKADWRRPLFERLRAKGLGVQVHYIPVHYQPYYRSLGYERGDWPVAEAFYERCVSLPMFPAMTDEDVHYVADLVRDAMREVRDE